MGKLTGRQIADEALDGWANLGGVLGTRIRTCDFAGALALVDAIGAAAEERTTTRTSRSAWGRVDIRLTSHDAGGVTERDVKLARVISALAEDAEPEPESDNAVNWSSRWTARRSRVCCRSGGQCCGWRTARPGRGGRSVGCAAVGLVPGVRRRAGPAALALRPVGRAVGGAAADRGRARRRRHPGQRRERAVVLDPGRPRGQQGVPVHLAGPRLSSLRRPPWPESRPFVIRHGSSRRRTAAETGRRVALAHRR